MTSVVYICIVQIMSINDFKFSPPTYYYILHMRFEKKNKIYIYIFLARFKNNKQALLYSYCSKSQYGWGHDISEHIQVNERKKY